MKCSNRENWPGSRPTGAGASASRCWDAWLDAEVEPEELERLTTKMSRLTEEQAKQVLEQAQS